VAYADFSISDLVQKFGLRITERRELFGGVAPVAPGSMLTEYLRETAPLALEVSTEKARSELIIAPILVEARRQRGGAVSLFSGSEFAVDAAMGLTGYCDFLFSRSPTQLEILAPVVAVVEAKNENIRQGFPQCIAEMLAARIFNERHGNPKGAVYGAVTTGEIWRFLRLVGDQVDVDLSAYYLRDLDRIVGVLVHALTPEGAAGAAA